MNEFFLDSNSTVCWRCGTGINRTANSKCVRCGWNVCHVCGACAKPVMERCFGSFSKIEQESNSVAKIEFQVLRDLWEELPEELRPARSDDEALVDWERQILSNEQKFEELFSRMIQKSVAFGDCELEKKLRALEADRKKEKEEILIKQVLNKCSDEVKKRVRPGILVHSDIKGNGEIIDIDSSHPKWTYFSVKYEDGSTIRYVSPDAFTENHLSFIA